MVWDVSRFTVCGLFKRSAEDVPELATTDPSPGEGFVQRAGCEPNKIFPTTKSIGFCHLWVCSVFSSRSARLKMYVSVPLQSSEDLRQHGVIRTTTVP